MIQIDDFIKALKLTVLSGTSKQEMDISVTDLNRPGMQFFGYYQYFAYERPQVIGKVEMTYLEELPEEKRRLRLEKYFSYAIPCVVICRGLTPPDDFLEIAKAHDVPVFLSHVTTTKFSFQIITYLNNALAPRITKHGVLVNVFGEGVLITGDSGVGKSEAALELIKRGHQLVADDVVDICRVSENRLVGESPEMVRYFMEIRGIGIIDIRAMYGVGSVILKKSIDFVMHLEKWDNTKEYDRLGLQEETVSILGVKVPHLLTPVKPGRNIAIIIEVAARNLSLKRMGISAAKELDNRLNAMLSKSVEQ
ncbi:MAG: HPr(Ser) kinase/phosphatase [Eubacteriales bacterium]|nr:HPr(Ser) kinase/phosphatase [Eubacteriales bacterium]